MKSELKAPGMFTGPIPTQPIRALLRRCVVALLRGCDVAALLRGCDVPALLRGCDVPALLRRCVVLMCLAPLAYAADLQDPAALQAHAEQFLKLQARSQPGKVSVQVKRPEVALPACTALDAFQPAGGRRIGKISVGVRCLAPSPWTVYLSAQVAVAGAYAVTRQSLPANHVLSAADFSLLEGDLGQLPADVITDVSDIVGYRTVSGIAAGAPLRNALLRPPLVVLQGQTTRVVLNGPGFLIQNEGQALANASRGDRVRVKIRSGQVVSGIAQDGQQVMIAF